MRWTEQQLTDYLEKTGVPAAPSRVDVSDPPFAAPSPTAKEKLFALGRLKTGEMNKAETRYDGHLWLQRHAGKILWHKFEGIKLRLADNTFYTCDFAVLAIDQVMEMHEVKPGIWQDDSRVKIKVAAALYPFRFYGVKPRAQKLGGGYELEEF